MGSEAQTISKVSNDRVLSIEDRIAIVRGHKVLIDSDLASLYGIETKVLNQAVRRNIERFPEDFLFKLTLEETRQLESLRSRIVTLNETAKRGRHKKYASYAFTEHGAVMLATILRSQTAIDASIQVVRTFVNLRNVLSEHKDLARKIEKMEQNYDDKFKVVFAAIKQLMSPVTKTAKQIGFVSKKKSK